MHLKEYYEIENKNYLRVLENCQLLLAEGELTYEEISIKVDKLSQNSVILRTLSLNFQELTYYKGVLDVLTKLISEQHNQKDTLYNDAVTLPDPLDYTSYPYKYHFIIGGVGTKYSEEVNREVREICDKQIRKFIDKYEETNDGFIAFVPTQVVPGILNAITQENIAVYGVYKYIKEKAI